MVKKELKTEAIRLRQVERLSYNEITEILSVSKSTLSLWLRDFPLSAEERYQRAVFGQRVRLKDSYRWKVLPEDRPSRKLTVEAVLAKLIVGKKYNTSALRQQLIYTGIKSERCERCGITEWLGESPPLQLHHIDGDEANNLLENLQILCANCHSKTDNFCGRNKESFRKLASATNICS